VIRCQVCSWDMDAPNLNALNWALAKVEDKVGAMILVPLNLKYLHRVLSRSSE
jgi:hypothetical protein